MLTDPDSPHRRRRPHKVLERAAEKRRHKGAVDGDKVVLAILKMQNQNFVQLALATVEHGGCRGVTVDSELEFNRRTRGHTARAGVHPQPRRVASLLRDEAVPRVNLESIQFKWQIDRRGGGE